MITRILKSTEETLTHVFYVGGVATSASGPVTFTVKRLDGTSVQSGTAVLGTIGSYSFLKAASATLDTHIVEWTGTFGSAAVVVKDFVEIVGDFIFSVEDMRNRRPALDPVKYPHSELAARRIDAEKECERICRQAFVPRYTRIYANGTGTPSLVLPDLDAVTLRTASTAVQSGGTMTPITGSSLAAIALVPGGVAIRDDGAEWPRGYKNILLEYEYGGVTGTPGDLAFACLRRARNLLVAGQQSVPDRAMSYSTQDGTVYRLTTPSREKTGIPDVDGVYEGYTLSGGFA